MPTQSSPVVVNFNVNIDAQHGVVVFEDTPVTLEDVVVCTTTLPVSHLYEGDAAGQALFEFQGQDNDISGRIVTDFATETRQTALTSALASILTNDSNNANALIASNADPFDQIVNGQNKYSSNFQQYKSLGHLALATYAHYIFGHVQATAAINNDTHIINHMNGEGETDAKICSSLVSEIYSMDGAAAVATDFAKSTSIVKQVIGQDASRAKDVDNDLTSPGSWQRLKWINGDKIYLQVTLLRPSVTASGTNSGFDVQQYQADTAAESLPSVGIKYSFEIQLSSSGGPPIINYILENEYIEGIPIYLFVFPELSGGDVSEWSISPALPTGMNFNNLNGVISGTPNGLSDLTNYTITATNASGSTTYNFDLKIVTPRALWAKVIETNYTGYDVCIDSQNNIYSLIHKDTNLPLTDLNGDGSVTIPATTTNKLLCLIKYNKTGTALWAKTSPFVAHNLYTGARIYCDSLDNVYLVTGNATSSQSGYDINGDGSLLINSSTTTYVNGMIIKYNSSGVAQWYKHLTNGDLQTFRVKGEIICAAYRSAGGGTIDINGDNSLLINITKNGRFLVFYNTSGVALDYKILPTTGTSGTSGLYITDIDSDSLGNIYLSGYNNNASILWLNAEETIGLDAVSGTFDSFLIKYNSSLEPQWAKSINGSSADIVTKCRVDSENNIYLCGTYSSTSTIDLGNSVILPISNSSDGFLIKFNSTGQASWVKTYNASDTTGIRTNIALDNADNIYIAGTYSASSEVPISVSDSLYLTSGLGLYIIKYSSNGEYKWFKTIDTVGTQSAYGFAIDSNYNLLLNIYLGGTGGSAQYDLNQDETVMLPSILSGTGLIKFGAPYNYN